MFHRTDMPAKFTKFNTEMKSKVNLNLEILSGFSPSEFEKIFNEFAPIQVEVILKNKNGQIAIFDFAKNWIEKVDWIEEKKEYEEDK